MTMALRTVGFLCIAVLAAGVLVGQQKPAPKAAPSKWGALGLSDEQKQKVYKIQGQYHDKVAAIEKQIAALRAEQQQEMEKVLTEEQKKQLKDDLAADKPPFDPKQP